MTFCPPWYFWLIVAPFVIFHGFYGFVFCWTGRKPDNPLWRWAHLTFQTWFNFAGALMGWLAGYAVYLRFTKPPPDGLGWLDVGLALTAALGIVGYLPQLLAGIAGTPTVLADYMQKKLGLLP